MVSPIFGLAKRLRDLPAIGVKVDVRRRRHDGNDLALRQRFEELGDLPVLHRLVDEVNVEQAGGIGDRRMAAVENPDLHEFVRGDVARERDPDLVERRAAGGELVLDHPLPELFAEDRPIVLDAPLLVEDRALAVGGRRRDPVDHPVREGDVAAIDPGERGIGHLGQSDNGIRRHVAVSGEIVAGHHRVRRDARRAAPFQPGDDEAESRLGR